MLGKELAYVALAVRDTAAAEMLFGTHLGLHRSSLDFGSDKISVFSIGESAIAIAPVGHPFVEGQQKSGVHHIALAVTDVNAAAVHAAERGAAPPDEAPAPGLAGSTRIALPPSGTASVRTWLTSPLHIIRSRSAFVQRIDHVGVASADNTQAVNAWSGRLGCELESQQTDIEVSIAVESFTSDKYGVVYHSRPPQPLGGLRVAFISVGDCELEFLENFDPSHGAHVEADRAGTTRQDQGAITKFVASRGEGLHHIALKTPDIDGVLQKLEGDGVPLIDRRGRPGSRRALIGFLDPRAAGGVLVHFVQRV